MRYPDFLKATVFLTAGEATALAAVTVAVAAGRGDTTLLVFAIAWWTIAAGAGDRGARRRPLLRRSDLSVQGNRAGSDGRSQAPAERERERPLTPPRSRLRSFAKSFHGLVLATFSGVSQARRAVATPKRISGRRSGLCASESITIMTPASAAARAWMSERSRRSGAALISSIVPVAAA